MMLADVLQQQAPEAQSFLNWVLSAVLILTLIAAVRGFLERKKGGSNDPLNVRMDDHFVSRREFDSGMNRMEKDHLKLSGELKGFAMSADEREKRILDILNHRDEKVSEQIERIAVSTRARIEDEAKWSAQARDKIHTRVTEAEKEIARVGERAGVCPRPVGCERDTQ